MSLKALKSKISWSNETSIKGLLRKLFNTFTPPERLSTSEWSEKYRRLSAEASSKQGGRFSFDDAPWQREPMDAPDDPTVGRVVLMWASQTSGKTETVNNIVCKTIDIDPCPVLVLQPTLAMGDTWSKDRLVPALRDTHRLRGKVKDARSRDANNTILHKKFPGGHLTIAGANSPASLASRPIRKLVCDEVDRYPASAGSEGDPIALAEKRTESFPDAIVIETSTPTLKGVSRIERSFESSDKRFWFCPCPKCDTWQTLKWCQVDFSTLGTEDNPAYVCEHCREPLSDRQRQDMVRAGEWRPTAPFNGIRGYHLNGIYCLFKPKKPHKTRLQQMVKQFLEAKRGGVETLKVWTNTFLAETWAEPGEILDASPLLERREQYSPQELPNDVVVLGCSVDVQGDRLEYEVIGQGLDEETWGVEYGKLIGDPEKDAVWSDLLGRLSQTFKRKDGVELKITCTAIDHRHKGGRVRKFIRTCGLPRVYAVYGANHAQSILVRVSHNKHYRMFLYSVNTDAAKDSIFARLKLKDHGPRFMHYPLGNGYNAETGYFDQLTSEQVRIEYHKGFPKRTYHKDPSRRNEALDLRVYFLAAMDILKPSIKHIQASLVPNKPAPEPKGYALKDPTQPTPQQPQPNPTARPRRKFGMGGGFVGGWRK